MSNSVAFQTFNLTNDVKDIDAQDAIFKHDIEYNKKINQDAPWKKEWVLIWLELPNLHLRAPISIVRTGLRAARFQQ